MLVVVVSADLLRAAAVAYRERAARFRALADAATPGPWEALTHVSSIVQTTRPCACDEGWCDCDPVAAEVLHQEDAALIAAVDPVVVRGWCDEWEALADWLALLARRGYLVIDAVGMKHALAVARAALGEQ